MLFFIGLSLYYTILFFFAVFYKEPGPFCRDEYWTFLRIAGISMTFFFLIIGFILWKQYKAQLSGIIADFLENLKQYDEEIIQNNELANEYINYFNKTVIKLDEKMYMLWYN